MSVSNDSILTNWVQDFAVNTLPVVTNLQREDILQAITLYLPEKGVEVSRESSASDLLEKVLGINVIVEYGSEKIGWTATSDRTIAAEMQQIYSNAAHSKARHALGINGLWIFLPELEFLAHYQDEDLYEKAPEPVEAYEKFPELLRLEERLECIIVEL